MYIQKIFVKYGDAMILGSVSYLRLCLMSIYNTLVNWLYSLIAFKLHYSVVAVYVAKKSMFPEPYVSEGGGNRECFFSHFVLYNIFPPITFTTEIEEKSNVYALVRWIFALFFYTEYMFNVYAIRTIYIWLYYIT